MHEQQNAQTKTYQETLQTELKKLGENTKTIKMLTGSDQNISVQTKPNTFVTYPVRSCRQAPYGSGIYLLKIRVKSIPFEVLCEQNTNFGGGWIVIQHRFNGSVDFYRNWTEYRDGFGTMDGEFWLGLEHIHQITKNRPHELLIEIKDFYGNNGSYSYSVFEIGSQYEHFMLKKLDLTRGELDSMYENKGKKFSTFDRDYDEWTDGSDAQYYHGAWWYGYSTSSNLNGHYQNTAKSEGAMYWHYFKNDTRGLSYSRMMIRDISN
ncbi:hypothetical protein ZHAS_00005886 [Anopheles sinensis]|uniref:Fibrinogen C-terminal domain-containing protein n=1 Tax=Anopheles sinensis TaxID=74873 RepID=A0A084VKE6_ANOSI|nr:hypothetical protein ZHAS_00005886 [Anopheles sinensis]